MTGLPFIPLCHSHSSSFLFQADRPEHPAGGDGARADGDAAGEDGGRQGGRRRGAGVRRRRVAHPEILVSFKKSSYQCLTP